MIPKSPGQAFAEVRVGELIINESVGLSNVAVVSSF
jgi:hypothetical protein